MKIAETKEVSCENVSSSTLRDFVESVKTCFMDKTTSIDTKNVTISTLDNLIGGLDLTDNKNIFFLPVGVSEKFPNLLGYIARKVSIKEISRSNFKGMDKLKFLNLYGNQIEKITSETFIDLKNLEKLYLGKKN